MPIASQPRLVPRSRAEQVRRANLNLPWHSDLYHRALTLHWAVFLFLGCVTYLAVNVGFAILYLLQPGAIKGADPGSYADAFFFSIQTIATIGYGQMSPATFYCNILVTIETMTGLVFLALATGITFARISRPTARVLFSDYAVVSSYEGVPTLRLRLANERRSQILQADVTVSFLRLERSPEGIVMLRFYNLNLVRSHTPIFAMSFTVVHVIDETSPLYQSTTESLIAESAELLLIVTGLEEMTSQTVHARHGYRPDEIRFGHRFTDIVVKDAKGQMIDYARFHDTEPAT